MSDAVHRFIFEDLDIRGALVQLGPAWHELQAVRDYEPAVQTLLGELAAVTAIIGSNLKQPGRISFHLRGAGPVRLLVMECDEQLRIRGLAKTAAAEDAGAAVPPEPTFSVRELLGDGQLVLTLQTNARAEHPYQSYVPLEGDSLAAIFEHYLTQSEQAPARLWLMADEHQACGLFLQKLPDSHGADARDPDGWNRIQHLAATLKPGELALPPETLLTRIFPDEAVRLFEPLPVSHHCPRDEAKVIEMLRTLGREEVEAALADTGAISIHDDICNHEYRFGREVLAHLFDDPGHTLH
ncbi:MAG: Hsp33 family molecular chaperone HslO [Gammaproteobacteria bacterium]|nr:Hsp33 family molecular chaperone HslO [Gammaproteobacteria bacterium]MBU1646527.1 Hsp33 family molecular chaperone HslO [Gammaproteobacteria bacterium]MBU1973714.1 Hsp33 family molecular chaperone HslO [Gammaproteobacteria bacterium]